MSLGQPLIQRQTWTFGRRRCRRLREEPVVLSFPAPPPPTRAAGPAVVEPVENLERVLP